MVAESATERIFEPFNRWTNQSIWKNRSQSLVSYSQIRILQRKHIWKIRLKKKHLKHIHLLLIWTSPTSCSHFLFLLLPLSTPLSILKNDNQTNSRTANWITSLSPRYKYAGRSGCFALGVKKTKANTPENWQLASSKMDGFKTRFSFWNSPFSGGPVYLKGGVRGFLFKNPFN